MMRPLALQKLTPLSVRSLAMRTRSEEHTSELQSPYDLVCRLLLEKKKQIKEQIEQPGKQNFLVPNQVQDVPVPYQFQNIPVQDQTLHHVLNFQVLKLLQYFKFTTH